MSLISLTGLEQLRVRPDVDFATFAGRDDVKNA